MILELFSLVAELCIVTLVLVGFALFLMPTCYLYQRTLLFIKLN